MSRPEKTYWVPDEHDARRVLVVIWQRPVYTTPEDFYLEWTFTVCCNALNTTRKFGPLTKWPATLRKARTEARKLYKEACDVPTRS